MVLKMKETLDEKITLTVNSIDLPRNGVITRIALLFNFTLSNAGASAWNGTYEDVVKAIEEIRVVADANDIKYSLSGLDVAIMNYYDASSKSVKLDDTITVDASGTQQVSFLLFLQNGDIHALMKEALKLQIRFNTTVATDVTISDAEVKVTLDKLVFEDANEWVEYFMGYIVEPKVWSKEKAFEQLNELSEVLELPTGAVAWRGFLVAFNSSNARADIVDKYAIVQTKPRRTELLKVDWRTGQELDKVQYRLDAIITGVNVIDYNEELVEGGFDLRAVDTGTFKLALKTTAQGKIRYISHELVPIIA